MDFTQDQLINGVLVNCASSKHPPMNITNPAGIRLANLNRINILLGKNGTGKSSLLKKLQSETIREGVPEGFCYCDYITPERSGFLSYEGGVETNVFNDAGWISQTRLTNQYHQFKQQSIARYREFERQVLFEIAGLRREELDYKFETYLDAINELLENIRIGVDVTSNAPKMYVKGTNDEIRPDQISSGESELIALAIECFHFQKKHSPEGRPKILLIDEPDVHLHPDLQVKFMRFIHKVATEAGLEFSVVIATHSTALLGALSHTNDVSVAFITAQQTDITFKRISAIYNKFLPVFGAHPLSNLFNEVPVLLVEGEDDCRIWQQAVRTSEGAIKIYPVVCETKNAIHDFEVEIKDIIISVYDDAKAYSLRDRDNAPDADLDNDLPIMRHRLRCYNSENLLLTEEVLASLGTSWAQLLLAIEDWLVKHPDHPKHEYMQAFKDGGYSRRNFNLKEVRNILVALTGTNKSWEIPIGQELGRLRWSVATNYDQENSIFGYLGKKLTEGILLPNQ